MISSRSLAAGDVPCRSRNSFCALEPCEPSVRHSIRATSSVSFEQCLLQLLNTWAVRRRYSMNGGIAGRKVERSSMRVVGWRVAQIQGSGSSLGNQYHGLAPSSRDASEQSAEEVEPSSSDTLWKGHVRLRIDGEVSSILAADSARAGTRVRSMHAFTIALHSTRDIHLFATSPTSSPPLKDRKASRIAADCLCIVSRFSCLRAHSWPAQMQSHVVSVSLSIPAAYLHPKQPKPALAGC